MKEPLTKSGNSRFQSVIGSLLYIMLGTCPDIAYAVTHLSQFSANPSKEYLDKTLYICCYLAGTRDYALIYDVLVIRDWRDIQMLTGAQIQQQDALLLDSSSF